MNFAGKKVLVTGANGFLGKHLCRALIKQGAVVESPSSLLDLTQPTCANSLFSRVRPDVVFHLAGYNGGIRFNRRYPADIFYKNTLMGLNVLEACARYEVNKVISVIASCAYPSCYGVLLEDDFLDGVPHPSVAGHGWAKRNLFLASELFSQQHGMNAVCFCPTTLYGPGDSFDLARTKVMGAMIRRFVDARRRQDRQVALMGTGRACREFLYVEDCAQLMVELAWRHTDVHNPMNLGYGQELSIEELANLVAKLAGYTGEILFNGDRGSDGQLRKHLVTETMEQKIQTWGLKIPSTPLDVGIQRTIEWYEEHHPYQESDAA